MFSRLIMALVGLYQCEMHSCLMSAIYTAYKRSKGDVSRLFNIYILHSLTTAQHSQVAPDGYWCIGLCVTTGFDNLYGRCTLHWSDKRDISFWAAHTKRKPPCIGGMELVSLSCNRVFISAESVGRGWCKIAIATKWYQFHTTDKCGFLFMPWITDQLYISAIHKTSK